MSDLIQSQDTCQFDIPAELKKLPGKPGVYIMRNSGGDILYIGKAVSLKNRVKQYFQSGAGHTPKVAAMVSKVSRFEYIVTDTEFEALILECTLIKKHRPRYNVLLKDDKHFPYIKITLDEPFPKIQMTRKIGKDKARYFGPYLNTHSIYDTLHELRKVFPLKNCKKELPRDIGKSRPCLNYHIGLCAGPCTGDITEEEYKKSIFDICIFLEGRHTDIVNRIEKDMETAAEEMRFEQAAAFRDKLRALKHIQEKQKSLSTAQYDQDVIACYSDAIDTCVAIFFIRGGKLVGREQYLFEGVVAEDRASLLRGFIEQFYGSIGFIPKEIILQEPIEDMALMEQFLRKKRDGKVSIRVPVRGEKLAMLKMAEKNAEMELANKRQTMLAEEHRIAESLSALAEALSLDGTNPERIEAFDISNFGKEDMVASLIVFENGRPARAAYRRYKIRTVEGPDDYASMREVLSRRFKALLENRAKFAKRPDLLLVDGGRGHVSAAVAVLESYGLDIPVAGMEKDDKHNTDALVTREGEIISIKADPKLLRFVSEIQDEAHRFAIEYSKKLAERRISLSELDRIRGVGKRRKMQLLVHFKSFRNIRAASPEELAAAPGIDVKTAQNIYRHFHAHNE